MTTAASYPPFEDLGRHRLVHDSSLGSPEDTPAVSHRGWATRPDRLSASAALIQDLLLSARDLSAAETRLARSEARWLTDVLRDRLYQEHGFASFADWTREQLGLEPRTARRRTALHRVLERTPELEAPLLEGRISISKALLLGGVSGDLTAWRDPGERPPVASQGARGGDRRRRDRRLRRRSAPSPRRPREPSRHPGRGSPGPACLSGPGRERHSLRRDH